MTTKSKKILLAIMICCLSCFLVGCWDNVELKNLDIVTSVGVDVAEDGQIDMYVEFFDASQNKEKVGNGTKILHVTGKTVLECEEKLNQYGAKTLFWSANEILFIGKNAGNTSYNYYLDYFVRDLQFRPTTKLVVVNGNLKDFYNLAKAEGVQSNSQLVLDILKEQKKGNSGLFWSVDINDFICNVNLAEVAPVIPVLHLTKENDESAIQNKFYIANMMVFKDSKMCHITSNEETKGLLWLRNPHYKGIIIIDLGNDTTGKAGFNVLNSNVLVKVNERENELPLIDIKVKMECSLNENTQYDAKGKQADYIDENDLFKQKITESVKTNIISAWQRSIDLQTDFLAIGNDIHQQKPEIWQILKHDWLQNMQNIPINVEVSTIITPQSNTTENIGNKQKQRVH